MAPKKQEATLTISKPNLKTLAFEIVGTAPYVQNKFSNREREKMIANQQAGSTRKKGTKKEPKDFDAAYDGAIHRDGDGLYGIPAPAFRNAMIDACRMVGFKMTNAKMSVFVLPDGFDPDDGTPLVHFTSGEPMPFDSVVRPQLGVTDIRRRPKWDEGWEATLRVQYDADQFTAEDVANLVLRAGMQVGVGEGRPFSKSSCGQGWGTFTVPSK